MVELIKKEYGENLTEDEIIKKIEELIVAFDPGKIRLLTGKNKKGIEFKYTSRQRRYNTGIKRNKNRRATILEENEIVRKEIEKFKFVSKTNRL